MIYVFLGLIILVVLTAALSLNDRTMASEEELNDVVDEDLINKVNTIEAITVKGVQYEVHTGPNGGSYYYKNGKRYYLTPKQKEKVYEL